MKTGFLSVDSIMIGLVIPAALIIGYSMAESKHAKERLEQLEKILKKLQSNERSR